MAPREADPQCVIVARTCPRYHELVSLILEQIQRLVERGDVRISEHGYEELAEDGLFATDVVSGLAMKRHKQTKLVHEGSLAAEVEIELTDNDEAWGPFLSLEEAEKLDTVRAALRRGDLKTAAQFGTVYRLTPI